MWIHPMLQRRFEEHGRGRWTRVPIDSIPAIGGCYAVFTDEHLIYIGSATNIRARLMDHGIGGKWGKVISKFGHRDRVQVKVAVSLIFGSWLSREARLIRRLQPRMNRTTWRTMK